MRLASIEEARRGSRLVVVSRDLTEMTDAGRIAPQLGAALDDWKALARPLTELSDGVASRSVPLERFHERSALSPLPQAAHRIAARLTGAAMHFVEVPACEFHAPREVVHLDLNASDVALDVSIAALLEALPQEASAEEAAASVRLIALVADFTAGASFSSGSERVVSLVSPVAVTPEAIEATTRGNRDHLALAIDANGLALSRADATAVGRGLTGLIERAAAVRPIAAGTVLTISIASERLSLGDTVRIDLRDASGHSLFGAIESRLARRGEV